MRRNPIRIETLPNRFLNELFCFGFSVTKRTVTMIVCQIRHKSEKLGKRNKVNNCTNGKDKKNDEWLCILIVANR